MAKERTILYVDYRSVCRFRWKKLEPFWTEIAFKPVAIFKMQLMQWEIKLRNFNNLITYPNEEYYFNLTLPVLIQVEFKSQTYLYFYLSYFFSSKESKMIANCLSFSLYSTIMRLNS